MNTTLEQLERDADARLIALAGALAAPPLRHAARLRLVAAVEAEAARLGPRRASSRLNLGGWRFAAGLATAAVIVAAMCVPSRLAAPLVPPEIAVAASPVDDWLDAASDSADSVSMIYQNSWFDDAGESEDTLDSIESLEDSFRSLEREIGA